MLGGSTLTEWLLKTGIVLNDLLIKISQVVQRCQDGCDFSSQNAEGEDVQIYFP